MPTGRIGWFDQARGYGRIHPTGGTKKDLVHFHITDIQESAHAALLQRGFVTFDIASGKQGPKATNIEAAQCLTEN